MLLLNIIFCYKNKISMNEIKNFPTLFFKHINLNQIFEFDYKDLFQETKNFYVFKIMLNENNKRFWNFGRPFLKKYQFIFDNDQKTITYIGLNNVTQEQEQKSKDDIQTSNKNFITNKLYIIFILAFIIIIIAVLIGLFLGKKIYNKNKKKRANELDDDYEYIEKKINDNEGIGIKFENNE